MNKQWIVLGSVLAGLSVALGAFGAHGLEERLEPDMMEIYQTAVKYHMMHAMAIILIGIITKPVTRLASWAGGLFTAGILFFSGSLYILSITGISIWGAVAPIGGTAFIAAWICTAVYAWKRL